MSPNPGPGPERTRSRFEPASLVMLAAYALPLLAFGFQLRRAPRVNASGQCTGIGFGCTLTPHDGLVFLGMFIGLPALGVALLLSGATAGLLARNRDRSAVTIGVLAAWPAYPAALGMLLLRPAG